MKAVGGLMLVLSGLVWGLGRSGELARRVELLTELLSLVRILKAEVGYSARPVGELLALSDTRLCRMARERPCFATDPSAALIEAGSAALSRQPDKELLAGFAHGLGASDTQGTMEHLGLYSALVEARLEEAREELAQKRRLFPALGLFAALTVTIIIL